MSRRKTLEAELEVAVLTADQLADQLSLLGAKPGSESMLFARALRMMARSIRLSLVAQADEVELLKLYLRLETTMRRASAELVRHEAPPSSRRPGLVPASQRDTVPPPPGQTPEEVWSSAPPPDAGGEVPVANEDLPSTRRPPAATSSQVRRKFEWPRSARPLKKKA